MRVQDAEEGFAFGIGADLRQAHGIYFTPAAIADRVLALAAPYLPAGPLTVIDPACGAGSFLNAARRRFPDAKLLGLELSPQVSRLCRARLPSAQILTGDALAGGWNRMVKALPGQGAVLWAGNPPFNGTSAVLKDKERYAKLCALKPEGFPLPPGTSLRDDFVFFLLSGARELMRRPGVLAFVTSASLLDCFLYAPVRNALLSLLSLREVEELPEGAFAGTQVRTCITVWTAKSSRASPPLHRRWAQPSAKLLEPEAPEWLLRPLCKKAEMLDRRWREDGEPLSVFIPVHYSGLKTRFDELLVDDSPARLLERVTDFLRCAPEALEDFALRRCLRRGLLPKLRVLKSAARGVQPEARNIRRFFRYAGARHRGEIPPGDWAYCYLDRRLIPRGDHRLQGSYDPHASDVKLVFNTRELPLSAALVETPGCVHAHRHARFAPLHVPGAILFKRMGGVAQVGEEVLNLSPWGRAIAQEVGEPRELFRRVVQFINSDQVQRVWAPAYGRSRGLPIPERALLTG